MSIISQFLINIIFGSIWFPIIVSVVYVLYWFSPMDLLPDWIPLIGKIDDFLLFFVMLWAWMMYLQVNILTKFLEYWNHPMYKWVIVGTGVLILLVIPQYLSKLRQEKVLQGGK